MRIIELRAENYKRLRAVDIKPDGDVVVVAGRNAQGKTSVLDAIFAALGGGAASKGTSKPVRDGQKEAVVTLDLGTIKVTRHWKSGGRTELIVESKEGSRYKSPQSLLDDLIGQLSFDPLAFANQSEREQRDTLVGLIELPFDPEQMAADRQHLFEERTEVGREVKSLKGQLDGLPEDDPGSVDRVDTHEVVAQLDDVVTHNNEVDRLASEARGIELRIGELREELARADGRLKEIEDGQRRLGPLRDAQALRDKLASAADINESVARFERRAQVYEEYAATCRRQDQMTQAITALDEQKAEALAVAAMPVPGLSFDEDGVLYRDIPFKQCSASEQLRVSVGMAMALNPDIRIVRIMDGSLLDSANMDLIASMAKDNDFQVWCERVDESGHVGVVIEDGEVASVNAQ